jgi:glucose/arabinose dehydrogenase
MSMVLTVVPRRRRRVAALAVLLVAGVLSIGLGPAGDPASAHPGHTHAAAAAAEPELPPGFRDEVMIAGLDQPVAARQAPAPDGRVFVLEKRGVLKVFDSMTDQTPVFALSIETAVMNNIDHGALGFTLDPDFVSNGFVYILHSFNYRLGDAPGSVPYWTGPDSPSYDDCTQDTKYDDEGCEVSNRLVRFTIDDTSDLAVGEPTVLITDWCQQYFSHSAGALAFGADGYLYASGGEGASYTDNENYDIGQFGNPCDDPLNAGGRVRAQDVRTLADPTSLSGSVIRVDPDAAVAADGQVAPAPGNPLIASADLNARRMVAHGFRNPFRLTIRPGSNDLYVGDVGESTFEEINRVGENRSQLNNSGWPCFEGPARYPNIRNDVPICDDLPDAAVEPPFYKYGHDEEVTFDEACGIGTGSVSALAFAQDDSFPTQLINPDRPGPKDALVFGDYSRGCLWYLPDSGTGVPDSGNPQILAENADGPVDLFTGNDGTLYYVGIGLGGFETGSIRRISYDAGRPDATLELAEGSLPYGDTPLDVTFDASKSKDPNPADVLTYRWDLDGDGDFDETPLPSEDPTISEQYTDGSQNVVVTVEVSDGVLTDTAQLTIYPGNNPPDLAINTPDPDATWVVGQQIAFSGSAIDPEDGELAAADVDWSITMEHCPAFPSCHSHPMLEAPGVLEGSVSTIDHELPSFILLRITATDSRGLTATKTQRAEPADLNVTFGTVPGGLRYSVNGRERTAGITQQMIAGAQVQVSTPWRQYRNGLLWQFKRWPVVSRPRSHTFTLPRRDAYTYQATFVRVRRTLTVTTSPAGLRYSALRANRRGAFTRQVQVGFRVGVTAPRTQTYRGWRYVFVRWSDRGAISHSFRMPDNDTVRRAIYRRAGRA